LVVYSWLFTQQEYLSSLFLLPLKIPPPPLLFLAVVLQLSWLVSAKVVTGGLGGKFAAEPVTCNWIGYLQRNELLAAELVTCS
jgi:hypothetical protein